MMAGRISDSVADMYHRYEARLGWLSVGAGPGRRLRGAVARVCVVYMCALSLHGETTLKNRSARMKVFPFLGYPSPPLPP